MRNFMQRRSIEFRPNEQLHERDWRMFREENSIQVKGGICPPPIRTWDDIKDCPRDLRQNLDDLEF